MKREYTQAIEYAEESIRLAREFSDTRLETTGMQILSTIYREQKRYRECEETASKAWNTDSTMLDCGPELAYNLAYANLQLGNREKGAAFFKAIRRVCKKA